jgi:hypothetical protein
MSDRKTDQHFNYQIRKNLKRKEINVTSKAELKKNQLQATCCCTAEGTRKQYQCILRNCTNKPAMAGFSSD